MSFGGAKLRGFGRGKPLEGTNGFSNGASNDGWNDDPPAAKSGFGGGGGGGGGFGKSSGFGSSSGGFGSGGGGFGAKGGGSGCRKCGEDGHFARECPQGGGGGGGGGRGCHKCGEEGHFARECPQGGGGGGGGGRACHKCGEEGHFARECPNAESGGGGGGFGKSSGGGGFGKSSGGGGGFGGFGSSSDSKSGGGFGSKGFGNSGGGDASGSGCRKCGEEGHFARECPNKPSGGDSGCRKCGEEGHFARECPNKPAGGGGDGACRKCGEEGHFARECPQGLAEGEKPREIYVPPEIGDEDSLFKLGVHQGINFDKYDAIEVEVSGSNRTQAVEQFDDMGLLPTYLENVKRAGYIKPTPIQKNAIPAILAGRDLMACAQTGSGKTAAFILPVLTGISSAGIASSQFSETQEPQAIIIAPTRELAIQIHTEARKFAIRTDVRTVVVYGGTSVGHQLRQVEQGTNVVVGTPGRLLDFIEKGKIGLSKVKYLILDEADRMLDMGFEPSIRKLVDTMGLPPKGERQTLMFSATFKPDIQKLASDFLENYLFITVGIVGGACSDVEQTFHEVDRLQKREHLCDILNAAGTNRVLVFVGQKRNADFLASFLSQSGYPTTSIHGDRLQREREEALRDFKSGKAPVMIATNVAARGLDIPDVTHVINYDLPSDIDEYVHRIGRTGRCGNIGKATSFYSSDTDGALASDLVKILSESRQEVPDWLAGYATGGGGGGGFGGRFASKDIRRNKDGTGDSGGAVDTAADDEAWD